MTPQEFENFLTDPHLSELLELQRTGNEALDVIRTLEVQHSRFLAWMFDSRKGHGQGEEILRDLLIHAALKAKPVEGRTRLTGESKHFFDKNPPAKLHAMSLSSAFVLPEFTLTERSRPDLVVLDPQNKFIVVIENKAAAAIRKNQLEQYREDVQVGKLKDHVKAGWGVVLLALDLKDELSAEGSHDGWLLLGYDWLSRAAKRADMQVERGNASASLVAAYCKRQLDGAETAADRRSNLVTAELVMAHPQVMEALKPLKPALAMAEWLKQPQSVSNDLAMFALQNRGAVSQLMDMDVYEALEQKVQKEIPELTSGRTWPGYSLLFIRPPGWERFEVARSNDAGADWALELRVHQTPDGLFWLRAWWYARRAREAGESLTCVLMKAFEGVPHSGPLRDGAESYDRFKLGEGLNLERLLGVLNIWQRRLADALAEGPGPLEV